MRSYIKWLIPALLLVIGVVLIKTLFPLKADLSPVPNPVTDKAITDWSEAEATVERHDNRKLYFGDLHVHTSISFDAYLAGTIASPSDAYQYAKGQAIEIFHNQVRIERPLDFTAVTDHSELMGELYTIQFPDAPGYRNFIPRYFRGVYNDNKEYGLNTKRQRQIFNIVLRRGGKGDPKHPAFFKGYATTRKAWELTLDAAEDHYEPGKFTTFAGFEWSLLDGAAHLHRNVIFKDMKVPDYPLSSLELTHEKQLWDWLDELTNEGSTVLAIPHNTNLAEGGAFRSVDESGNPIDRAYAQLRQDYEPLIEIHQAKGNSEVHADFWKNDEFADFENYSSGPAREDNYVRYALKKGLQHEAEIGVNPFKFGLIGSTDTHSGTPGNTEESDSFISNHGILDAIPEGRLTEPWALDMTKKVYEVINPGGLIAVWAKANTRGELYDAMKRKEVYATSGSRIQLRFFGGWGFGTAVQDADALVDLGYQQGFPMGSDLQPNGEAPEFLIWVSRDSMSGPIDKVQVIKGWENGGALKETIYKVADNTDSLDALFIHWTDPDYNIDDNAFYYVRVIEQPVDNWRLYDKIRYGSNFPDGTPLQVRERAWSSPIWLSPYNSQP